MIYFAIFLLFFLPILIFNPTWVASIGVLLVAGGVVLVLAILLIAKYPGETGGIFLVTLISWLVLWLKERKSTR